LVVQRFRITQVPIATYYDNYEKKNNQLGFILPLLRFPKVKKKWSKEPSWSIQSSRTTSRRSSYLRGNGVSAVTPCSVAKKWPLRSVLNEAAQHSRYKAQIPPLATFRFCLTHW